MSFGSPSGNRGGFNFRGGYRGDHPGGSAMFGNFGGPGPRGMGPRLQNTFPDKFFGNSAPNNPSFAGRGFLPGRGFNGPRFGTWGPPSGPRLPPPSGMNMWNFEKNTNNQNDETEPGEFAFNSSGSNVQGQGKAPTNVFSSNNGGAPGPQGPPLSPSQINPLLVLSWLDCQDPNTLRRIMFHCRWLLEQMGISLEDAGFRVDQGSGDMSEWYEGEAAAAFRSHGPMFGRGGPPPKRMRGPYGGFMYPRGGGPVGPPGGPMQWTPSGWAPKDNIHKVTSTIKPLPEPEVIPPKSATYPEAADDRGKLKQLENNLVIMKMEVTKLTRKYKIHNFDENDLSKCPEEAQPKLQTALHCIKAAEKTLNEFKEYIVEEKYKEWNLEQKKKREESIKSMIGETPTGVPHKKLASPSTTPDAGSTTEADKDSSQVQQSAEKEKANS